MRRIIAVLLLVGACGEDAPDLVSTLDQIPGEVQEVVASLHEALDVTGDTRSNLYLRVSSLNTTVLAGELYDRTGRLAAPGLEADLGRYTRFVGDLLLASGDVDTAVAQDDLEILALSWLRVEAGAGVLAVGLEPDWCPAVTPPLTADLCRPPDLATSYDETVERVIRRFLARYRPVVRIPGSFGDGVRIRVALTLAEEVLASIDAATAELAALIPPDNHHGAVQRSFAAHLEALRMIWEEVPESLDRDVAVTWDGGFPDIVAVDAGIVLESIWQSFEQRLQTAACDGAEVFAAARTPLRANVPASTLPALGELWFYGEGTGCP